MAIKLRIDRLWDRIFSFKVDDTAGEDNLRLPVVIESEEGAISGTNSLPVQLNSVHVDDTLVSLNDTIEYAADGQAGTVVFQVTGTWKGKIVAEGTVDGIYNNLSIVQPGGVISFAGVNNDNMNGVYRVLIMAGYTNIRLRMSSYTSGTAIISVTGSQLIPTPFVWQLTHDNLNGNMWMVDELGVSYGVKHIENKPRVSSMPYLYDIAEGNVAGHTSWSKIGYNDALSTSQETMWSNSTEYVFPTVAGQMEVVSSDNTQDKAGGTGALTVRVGYLKSDYSESSVILTLNGTTAVPTGASHADMWRINSFRVMTTGTNNSPVGNLTLRPLGGGTTYGYIRLGKTRARSCFYTVPLGKTLYITSVAFSAVGTKYLIFTNHANYDQATGVLLQRGLYHPFTEIALLNASYSKELEIPTKLLATTDLKVSVIAEAAGSLATCHLRGWLE